mgnify:CR=1 FL=1
MRTVTFRLTLIMEDGDTAFAVIGQGGTYALHRLRATQGASEGHCLHLGDSRSLRPSSQLMTAFNGCSDG